MVRKTVTTYSPCQKNYMCGIAGIFNIAGGSVVDRRMLERMIFPITHRGPDGYGFFLDHCVGLAHARLSIIDLEGGWQPIHNEDKTKWIIFNGEIFNYIELRLELERRGHKFYTDSDTEVILHLYEEKQEKCLDDLNGQFAIAIYDSDKKEIFLARDRMGIRPFYYTFYENCLYFASEIKSIFSANSGIPRGINPEILSEIFTFWMPGGDESIFNEIRQLRPGHWARVDHTGKFHEEEYWDIPFTGQAWQECQAYRTEEDYAEGLRELLIDAVRLRLRSDVPVGAYLSGGIDSSAITSLVRNFTSNPLKTFSVTFSDHVYDERSEQKAMVDYLQTDHHSVNCSYKKIADAFPEVIWHTETPVLRTASAPLFILSELVNQHDYKVVLTGEGADELLGGYDIFKEAKIRAFIKKSPDSAFRPLLLKRLYPYLALSPTQSAEYAKKFFDTEAMVSDLFYAHRPRWKTTERTKVFLSKEVIEQCNKSNPIEKVSGRYQAKLRGLDYFSRAQYLESKMLLGNYLLSSQGDRMAMAHSVEGRFPFLDHRVVEFACTIPVRYRMKVLNEKNILKKSIDGLLPDSIVKRKKQPYMAPDILSFFGDSVTEYIDYYLSEKLLNESGLFKQKAVSLLVAKCRRGGRQGFRENMAFVGILSTQIAYDKFIKNFQINMPEKLKNIKIF